LDHALDENGDDQIGRDPISGTVINTAKLTSGWRDCARRMRLKESTVKYIRGHSGRNAGIKIARSPKLDIPIQVQRTIGDWTPTSEQVEYYTRDQTAEIADAKLSCISLHEYDNFL